MEAMRLPAMCHYSPPLVILSVILAIVSSLLALWLTFLFRHEPSDQRLRKAFSVLAMGAANPIMHYTGMAAASFTRSELIPDLSHAVSISLISIEGITLVPVMLLAVALVTSLVDRLQKAKSLLDELFEQAPQAVALLNADDRVVRINREFPRIFGYTPQETLGRRLSELTVPDELREEYQRYAELSLQGQRVEAEGIRKRKDGSRLNTSVIRVPVTVPGGQVEIYAIYRDITERKQAERQLRDIQARMESVLNSVADVHILFDREWHYVYVNKAAVRAIGEPREHILRQTLWEIYPDIQGTELEHAYRRAMAERVPMTIDFYYLRTATWWENRFYPAPEGLAVFATNVTDRKRAELELRDSQQQLRALAAYLQSVREEERARIARELHDEVGQALTAIKLTLERNALAPSPATRADLSQALALANELIGRVRNLSLELRPAVLDDFGLLAALRWHLDRYTEQFRIAVDFQETGLADRRFSSETETAAYRIVQEALTNIARHAQVDKVSVAISANQERLRIEIKDQGIGFDPAMMPTARTGGLYGMRERVIMLGGKLDVESASSGGTVIRAEFPLHKESQAFKP
jgi:two-component system sensor histidine kinase UhpB